MPADSDVLPAIEDASATEAPPERPLHLILIDGSGFIFRAFHALPPMTRPDGTPVNAVFGFTNMLAKLLREHVGTHIAVIFDAGAADVSQSAVRGLQGAPSAAAGRADPAIRIDPRGDRGLLRPRDRAGRLGGGRPDRRLRRRGGGCRRPSHHSLLRQGPDAAHPARRGDAGPDQAEADRASRGDGEVRRHSRQDGRGAGADRRLGGQCAGGARHRAEGRGATHQRVRRPGNGAGCGAGDEALEAPRHADRACREGADFARTGEAARRCAAADAGREAGGPRAGQADGWRHGCARRGSAAWSAGWGWTARLPLPRRRWWRPRRAAPRRRCRCRSRRVPRRRPGRCRSDPM